MKDSSSDFKNKCCRYSDLSSGSDNRLYLMSSLLLKVNDVIEVREARTLGLILDQYLTNKIILDHVFWERSLKYWNFNEEESAKMINDIKMKM